MKKKDTKSSRVFQLTNAPQNLLELPKGSADDKSLKPIKFENDQNNMIIELKPVDNSKC